MVCLIKSEFQKLWTQKKKTKPLTDPGGERTRRAPPNGFIMPNSASFSQKFLQSLRSQLILSIILIEIWPKTRTKMTFTSNFYFNLQHFQWCSNPPLPQGQILETINTFFNIICLHMAVPFIMRKSVRVTYFCAL